MALRSVPVCVVRIWMCVGGWLEGFGVSGREKAIAWVCCGLGRVERGGEYIVYVRCCIQSLDTVAFTMSRAYLDAHLASQRFLVGRLATYGKFEVMVKIPIHAFQKLLQFAQSTSRAYPDNHRLLHTSVECRF